MFRTEIRFTGFGGQGVVLASYIIGHACAVNSSLHATMIQSFGPEARGSACAATLAISDEEVLYPYVGQTDFLVAMSTEGYEKYIGGLSHQGVLIYESDLVNPDPADTRPKFGIPSTRLAEELGRRLVQNIVMLGFVTAVTRVAAYEAMKEAVLASVPAGTEDLNLKAFEAGWQHYEKTYRDKAAKAEPVTA